MVYGRSKIAEANDGYDTDKDVAESAGKEIEKLKMNTKPVRGVSKKEKNRLERENKASAIYSNKDSKKTPASAKSNPARKNSQDEQENNTSGASTGVDRLKNLCDRFAEDATETEGEEEDEIQEEEMEEGNETETERQEEVDNERQDTEADEVEKPKKKRKVMKTSRK